MNSMMSYTSSVAVSPGRLIRLRRQITACDTSFFVVAVSPGRLIRLRKKISKFKKWKKSVAVSPGRLIRLSPKIYASIYTVLCRSQPGPFNKVEKFIENDSPNVPNDVAVSPGRLIRLRLGEVE